MMRDHYRCGDNRARVYREIERVREVVASIVTAACGEDSEQEVVASVFIHCILFYSDSLQFVDCRGFSLFGFSTLTSVYALLSCLVHKCIPCFL